MEQAGSLREERFVFARFLLPVNKPNDLNRQEAETKKLIATLFLQRFTLTKEETEAITERDVPVGERFFAAMDKSEQIRDDHRLLLSGEDGPTQTG
jgi:hypothetical protein